MKNLFLAISVFVACVIPGVGYANDVIVKGLVMGSKDISQMPACTNSGRDFPCIGSQITRKRIDIRPHRGGSGPDLEAEFDSWDRLLASIARAAKLPAGVCSGSRHPSVANLDGCRNLFMEDVNIDIDALKSWVMVKSEEHYIPDYRDRKDNPGLSYVIPYHIYRIFKGDVNAPYFFVSTMMGRVAAIRYYASQSRISHADMVGRYGKPVGVYGNYFATKSDMYCYSRIIGWVDYGNSSANLYGPECRQIPAQLHSYSAVMFKSGSVNIEHGCPLSGVEGIASDHLECYVHAFSDDIVDEYKKAFSEKLKEWEAIKVKNEEVKKRSDLMNKYRGD